MNAVDAARKNRDKRNSTSSSWNEPRRRTKVTRARPALATHGRF